MPMICRYVRSGFTPPSDICHSGTFKLSHLHVSLMKFPPFPDFMSSSILLVSVFPINSISPPKYPLDQVLHLSLSNVLNFFLASNSSPSKPATMLQWSLLNHLPLTFHPQHCTIKCDLHHGPCWSLPMLNIPIIVPTNLTISFLSLPAGPMCNDVIGNIASIRPDNSVICSSLIFLFLQYLIRNALSLTHSDFCFCQNSDFFANSSVSNNALQNSSSFLLSFLSSTNFSCVWLLLSLVFLSSSSILFFNSAARLISSLSNSIVALMNSVSNLTSPKSFNPLLFLNASFAKTPLSFESFSMLSPLPFLGTNFPLPSATTWPSPGRLDSFFFFSSSFLLSSSFFISS
ncbi:p38 [Anthurium mosaic-associated virus]|uniref:p38 n=1 Tax=Anthurium mosaic-associated virus TaxID=664255 RepID=D9U545_9VIRU|nr:p38 [Anthurium mosaic-associated virus]ACU11565.1 p38 [Anthurium mosaic-associated virus]